MKRTPMPPRTKPLRSTKRINPVSARRRARDKDYPAQRQKRAEHAGGLCEARLSIDCRGVGGEAHHVAGRLGPDPHRLDNLRWFCGRCHALVHREPEMAYSLGLSVKRNTRPEETT